MASSRKAYRPPRALRLLLGPIASRPRLMGAIAAGVLAAVLLTFIPNELRPSTRGILAWDVTLITFLVSTFLMMNECDGSMIRQRAASQDEGQHFILGLTILAAAISIIAIGAELSLAKEEHGWLRALRIVLAFATVAGSWLFVQVMFALHYAHEFFAEDDKYLEQDAVFGVRAGLVLPFKRVADRADLPANLSARDTLPMPVWSATIDLALPPA